MKILKDFRAFAMRGNVLDLAVGVIIGGAFGKIVSSAVSDLIMPPVGLLVGGVNFTDIKFKLRPEEIDAAGKLLKPAVTLNIGNFLQNVVDFTIIAFCVFLVVRMMMVVQKKLDAQAASEAGPVVPTRSEALLEEIRDLLKKK